MRRTVGLVRRLTGAGHRPDGPPPDGGGPTPPDPPDPPATLVSHDPQSDFWSRAQPIERRHRAQTVPHVEALRAKYAEPVFGDVAIWDLVTRLGGCIDPTDCRLYCATQLTHVLQVVEGLAQDGVDDPDLLLAALIHDLGKLLLLTDEDPANIVCMNTPIGADGQGIGLDNCTFQWNHDEFGYQRFKDLVPDHVAWLIRYHSVDPVAAEPLMDARDRDYHARYLLPFRRYDHETKSAHLRPSVRIESYRDLLESTFPDPIPF